MTKARRVESVLAVLVLGLFAQLHGAEVEKELEGIKKKIAKEKQAIKDLQKETRDRTKAMQELQFEFLQAQQGFAATLLSNLLPTAAIAGTVGGTAISTPTIQIPHPAGGGPQVDLSRQAQVSAARDRGVTQAQMGTLIDLTRQMIRVLHSIAGDRQHPEAQHQRRTSSAVMDTV